MTGPTGLTIVLIGIGAAVGAPLRYLIDRAVQARHETHFPWGTLTVNVVASLLLGLAVGAGEHLGSWTAPLVDTGLCGTLSTFSALSFETWRLSEIGQRFDAVANVVASLVAGIGAAGLGLAIAASLG